MKFTDFHIQQYDFLEFVPQVSQKSMQYRIQYTAVLHNYKSYYPFASYANFNIGLLKAKILISALQGFIMALAKVDGKGGYYEYS